MGENTSTTVISCRIPHDSATALKKMAKDRGISMNRMISKMLARRVAEIRAEEGW